MPNIFVMDMDGSLMFTGMADLPSLIYTIPLVWLLISLLIGAHILDDF